MQSIKEELLAALAVALEQLAPGAGGKAAFESPKVAGHGDFACTAAMQLAKPLKQNPRQTAENLRVSIGPWWHPRESDDAGTVRQLGLRGQ